MVKFQPIFVYILNQNCQRAILFQSQLPFLNQIFNNLTIFASSKKLLLIFKNTPPKPPEHTENTPKAKPPEQSKFGLPQRPALFQSLAAMKQPSLKDKHELNDLTQFLV